MPEACASWSAMGIEQLLAQARECFAKAMPIDPMAWLASNPKPIPLLR